MAFKMKGFNPGKGTGMGSAFHQNVPGKMMRKMERKLKRKEYEPQTESRKDIETDITPQSTMKKKSAYKKRTWAEAKKANPKLSELAKKRNALRDSGDTSSDEYKKVQNEINKAYDVSKRHELSKKEKDEKTLKIDGKVVTPAEWDHYEKTGELPGDDSSETPADSAEDKFEDAKGQKDFDVDPTAANVEKEKKKDTSDPFGGTGEEKEKKDRKKLKDTKLGKALGVGQGDKRKKRRADRKEAKNWQKAADEGKLDVLATSKGMDPDLMKTPKARRKNKRKEIRSAREKKREIRKTKGRKSEEFQAAKTDVKKLKEEKRAI